jgi:uncharacterized SAM-binding protein YcdF (DUF218 family)
VIAFTFGRFVARFAMVVAVAVVLFAAWIVALVWHGASTDNAEPGADAIVVLGAAQYNGVPSPVLRARLDHAADLWKQKYAPVVVVTGGKAPGDTSTEASASARYLMSKGIPDSAIWREVQGRTSWQSLQASARFMHNRNVEKVILVSDSFHNARISAMAGDLGLDAEVSATTTSPIVGRERLPYLLKEVGALGAGKLLGFSRVASIEHSFAS